MTPQVIRRSSVNVFSTVTTSSMNSAGEIHWYHWVKSVKIAQTQSLRRFSRTGGLNFGQLPFEAHHRVGVIGLA